LGGSQQATLRSSQDDSGVNEDALAPERDNDFEGSIARQRRIGAGEPKATERSEVNGFEPRAQALAPERWQKPRGFVREDL